MDAGQGLRRHRQLLSSTAKIADTDSQRSDGTNRRTIAGGDARGMAGADAARVCDRRNNLAVAAHTRAEEGLFPRAQSTWGKSLAHDARGGIPRRVQWPGSATRLGSHVWRCTGERARVGRASFGEVA